jgi:sugar O-acyltransferase (sialic acid O-acetyltransferase NeuD family)
MLIDRQSVKVLWVCGAGGHAKVVIDAARLAGLPNISVIDDDRTLWGSSLLGLLIGGPAPINAAGEFFHVAIGNNSHRERKFAQLAHTHKPLTVVHPASSVSGLADIDAGCFVAAHSVIGPEAAVGLGSIVNHGAVIDHDCVVGPFCHIAPNATLAGGVKLGKCVLIGVGATIMPGVSIGDGCVVGAGAVVVRNQPVGQTLVGIPAKHLG